MSKKFRGLFVFFLTLVAGCSHVSLMGGPRAGGVETASPEQMAQMAAVGKKVNATIVWSSSRFGNHDIFKMNADGSEVAQLTSGDFVDWFPRFSPDGKTILFVRSKKGWVSERDANRSDLWDLFMMSLDGDNVIKVASNASWGNWLDADHIIFVRDSQVMIKQMVAGTETVFLDGASIPDLENALMQQPQLSPDGRFLALTLRGGKRETGIWNQDAKTWTKTGEGCQINWFPDGKRIFWVNPSGNGGSEVLRMQIDNGRPEKEFALDDLRFMDLPGRRSHEYFPQLSAAGDWMVWAATQRGHDHDIADYEIYVWQVGTPAQEAARLTFHSGNDRWPDIHVFSDGH